MREPGLAKGAIVLTLFCLLVAITALVVKADPVPPTVSLLNPRAGGIVSGPFKVQVQAWDAAAEVTAVAVSGTDGGDGYPYSTTRNPNYSPGTGSAIWEVALTLAPGSYTLMARATSGSGEGLSRSVPITVAAAGVGDGTLLVRDNSSTLCLDCHALATHSSQYTSTKYGPWAIVCRDCHTPHQTRNLGLIRETIVTPNSGSKWVDFRMTTGDAAHSYVDSTAGGSTTGLCQVCHTQTQGTGGVARWRNSGNDDSHYTAPSTQRCTSCHLHTSGFTHGAGTGTGCITCHGHDVGYEYAAGQFSQGKGTAQSHSTHTENDADDLRGPNVACDECHNTSHYPTFKDGATTLAATTVCNTCHSPGGTYDGVNDPVIGAKANWRQGVYEGNALRAGKEKWCAGCHDNGASVIQAVNAPNVIGDESAATSYGTGYGYYKTGHGLPTDQTYPWTIKPGDPTQRAGAGLGCQSCHDSSSRHTDGMARTYRSVPTCSDLMDCWSFSGTPDSYRNGYRLKLVNGNVPMVVPRMGWTTDPSEFRLCFNCHDAQSIFTMSPPRSNFRAETTRYDSFHIYHLGMQESYASAWPSDWNYSSPVYVYGNTANVRFDSRVTCITCHNVHGSARLAMVNDGTLVQREPGFQIWYNAADMSHSLDPNPLACPQPIVPVNNLADSTGFLINMNNLRSTAGFCIGCHGGCSNGADIYRVQYRWPYEKLSSVTYQAQGSTGSTSVAVTFSQGVYSESNATGNLTVTDFTLYSLGGKTITAINHTAGQSTATVTLSAPPGSPPSSSNDSLGPATPLSIFDASGKSLSMGTPKQCIDTGSPIIGMGGVWPRPGSYFNPPSTNISFELVDYCAGIHWDTLTVRVDRSSDGSKTYGRNSPEVSISGGGVTINPANDFGDEDETVTISVSDDFGNAFLYTWTFCTGGCGM